LYHRLAIECCAGVRPNLSGNRKKFLLAIAEREPRPIRLPARRCEQGPDLGQPSGDIGAVRFVEPWPPVVKSLVKPRSEERFRADNVDGFNTRSEPADRKSAANSPSGSAIQS
jgi:hypothetical protein